MAMGDQVSVRCAVAPAVEQEVEEQVVVQKPLPKGKGRTGSEDSEESGEETTPTTTASDTDAGDIAPADELDDLTEDDAIPDEPSAAATPSQLGPGIYHEDDETDSDSQASARSSPAPPATAAVASPPPPTQCPAPMQQPQAGGDREECESSGSNDQPAAAAVEAKFTMEETVFIFDWDDTVLPSTWVQRQGLRLDEGSSVNACQREQLAEVANLAAETIRLAKQHGRVVFVTNAERGWIELSCQKFLPTLAPSLENVKLLSARTTYECARNASPLEWKLRAFEDEIARNYGGVEALVDPSRRKNVLSLGDSVHERDALLRATTSLPNCCSKSLKFAERPDLSQICKQHSLVISCFERIVHHDGNLDLCIRCA